MGTTGFAFFGALLFLFQSATDPQLALQQFPKSGDRLRRRKRDWVIPPLAVSENQRGPFPLKVAEVRTTEDGRRKIIYSITGPGADQPPVGLFSMDRNSGSLYVTRPLDREEKAQYMMKVHAVVEGSGNAEEPMDIIVFVIDQNDNRPVFNESTYRGEVPEASAIARVSPPPVQAHVATTEGWEVMRVVATDADEPNNDNSNIRYRILSQTPQIPHTDLFAINPISGAIRVSRYGLDREKNSEYVLYIQAADNRGAGLTTETKVILVVTDSNDHSPVFTQTSTTLNIYKQTMGPWSSRRKQYYPEHLQADYGSLELKEKAVLAAPQTELVLFLSSHQGLDFEKIKKHTLLIAVENEIPFVNSAMNTSTATVTVNVKDVNEAPVFNPTEKVVGKREDLAVGETVVQYTATDPDETNQKVRYKITRDPGDWLNVDNDVGLIKVKRQMDRESKFVTNDKYIVVIAAYDDDKVPATGTGTLIIQLEDVNDEAPTIVEYNFTVCNKDPAPQLLSVTDKDTGPDHNAPFSVSLRATSRSNWTAVMNETNMGIILKLAKELPSGHYDVVLTVRDFLGLEQDNIVGAEVCDCTGENVDCTVRKHETAISIAFILKLLIVILLPLTLVLLLLFARWRRERHQRRQNCNEEGGREDENAYDDVVIPANPEEIDSIIDDVQPSAEIME
ncbi:blastomere cadherin [Pholidichthys leucotaenia]